MASREVQAVAKALQADETAETAEEVAEVAIAALDAYRARVRRFLVVGRLTTGDGEWQHFASGPYSTRLAAAQKGEQWVTPVFQGEAKWGVFEMHEKAVEGWREMTRPEKADKLTQSEKLLKYLEEQKS